MTELQTGNSASAYSHVKATTFYSVACISYVSAITAALLFPSPLRTAIILPLVLILPGWLTFSLLPGRYASQLPQVCYAFGISILELMFLVVLLGLLETGLHSRMFLPAFSLVLAETILTLLLFSITLIRTRALHIDVSAALRVIRARPLPYLIILVPLPLLSAVGAIQLNNGATGILALSVPAYVLALFLYMFLSRRSPPSWFYPAAVFIAATSLTLQYSLRSPYLFGPDVHEEFMVFTMALRHGFWSPDTSPSSYNSCLSVTALPLALTYLTHLSEYTLFKTVMPSIVAFLSVVVFSIARNQLSLKRSLLAVLFFIGYPSFTGDLSTNIRTGVALVFLGLFILAYFDSHLSRSSRMMLLTVSGLGIIVSHYSTAYLFLAMIVLWKVIGGYILNRRLGERGRTLQWVLIVFMVVSTLVWQAGINSVTGGIKQFVVLSSENYASLLSQGASTNQASLRGLFVPGQYRGVSAQEELNRYIQSRGKSDPFLRTATLSASPMPSMSYNVLPWVARSVYIVPELLSKLLKILIVVAPMFLMIRTYMRRSTTELPSDFVSLGFVCTILLIGVAVVPGATLFYGLYRTFQTVLIVVAISVVVLIGLLQRFARLPRFTASVPFVAYFVLYSGLLIMILGGRPAYASLSNSGSDYERLYEGKAEYALVQWMAMRYPHARILSDESMFRKLQETGKFTDLDSSMILMPVAPTDKSLVAEGTTNLTGVGYAWLNGETVRYVLPDISSMKNRIYSSGGGAIYQ